MKKYMSVVALAVVILVFSASKSYAYLDAGSGSMLLQLLLGGVAGLGVIAKLYWSRLTHFLHLSRTSETPTEETHPGETDR